MEFLNHLFFFHIYLFEFVSIASEIISNIICVIVYNNALSIVTFIFKARLNYIIIF